MFRASRLKLIIFGLSLPACFQAQDLHFSQFYHHPQHHNPALTGVFQGQWRIAGLHRNQWTSVPVDYRTYALAGDVKLRKKDASLIALGAFLQSDRAGDAGMRWTQGGVQLGVSHALGARHALSAGAGLSFAQRAFNLSGLRFKNQWTGDVFDASLPPKERLAQQSAVAPLLAAGFNWHYEPGDGGRRRQFDLGVSAQHLNRPSVQFTDDSPVPLPARLVAGFQSIWQAGETWDLVAMGLYQHMGAGRSLLAGGGIRRWLNLEPGRKTAVRFTLSARFGDALIPAFQLEYEAWTAGISYDWNTSAFQTATKGRGGMEIALIYRPLPVPPPKGFKACPIF